MTDPRWLTPDERDAWLGLIGVVLLLPSTLDGQLQRDAGLTTFDYLVLAMLSEAPDHTLQLKNLAALANGSLSRLSHAVSRLEDRGLVERRASARDGRARDASLTEAGLAKVVQSAPAHVEMVRQIVFDDLDPEAVAQLATIMRSVMNRLDPQWYSVPPTPN